jgi:hypothetical protein
MTDVKRYMTNDSLPLDNPRGSRYGRTCCFFAPRATVALLTVGKDISMAFRLGRWGAQQFDQLDAFMGRDSLITFNFINADEELWVEKNRAV